VAAARIRRRESPSVDCIDCISPCTLPAALVPVKLGRVGLMRLARGQKKGHEDAKAQRESPFENPTFCFRAFRGLLLFSVTLRKSVPYVFGWMTSPTRP